MYAVIKVSGKQHKVAVGDIITTDRMSGKEGDTLTLDQVLLTADGSEVKIGTPTLTGVSVSAKLVAHTRGPKIRVATFKAKSRYRKTKGHRQDQTKLQIVAIGAAKKTSSPAKKTATKAKAASKTR